MKQIFKPLTFAILLFTSLATQAQTDTIGYDNGVYASSIYSRNSPTLYWGISIPPDELSTVGNQLSAVMLHTIESFDVDLSIYSGSEYTPTTLLATQTYTSDSTRGWKTISLDTLLNIEANQTLWITFHKEAPVYAGDYCSDIVNNAHASCMSDDGITWFNAADYGLGNPFMIRAIFTHNNETIAYTPECAARVIPHDNKIEIQNANNHPVWIYNIDGRCIVNGQRGDGSYTMPTTGIYMVQIADRPARKIALH